MQRLSILKRVRDKPAMRAAALAGKIPLRSGEFCGSVADLGVFVPLTAALVLVNGLDASSVLISAGLLLLLAGAVFRIPFPVQPLKALTAVAVAGQFEAGVIHAAGLEIGLFLLLLSVSGVADRLSRIFQKPVVRALQFGVGLLLVKASAGLLIQPPEPFSQSGSEGWRVVFAVLTLGSIALSVRLRHYRGLLAGLAVGTGIALISAPPGFPRLSLSLPDLSLPSSEHFWTAFVLLVIPQIPLTFGNAVVAVTDLAEEYFGPRAGRVTPRRVCLSAAFGNLVSAVAGGMPMCHGAGGLTAHYRLGARAASMNVLLGGSFLAGGLFLGSHVLRLFAFMPLWALAALLAYAGIRHAMLAFDQRGFSLALALIAGLAGALVGNLTITAAMALLLFHGARFVSRLEPASGS